MAVLTAIHTGLLGALLTLSPSPWYPSNTALGAPGLGALGDQQLGGVLMWGPSNTLLAAIALILCAAWLRESDRRAARGQAIADGSAAPPVRTR